MKPLSNIMALGLCLIASAALAGSPPVAAPPHAAAARSHPGHHHGHHAGWGQRPFRFVGPVVIQPWDQQPAPVPAPAPAVAPTQPRPQVIVVVHDRPRCFEPRIIVLKPARAKAPTPRVRHGRPKLC